MSKQDNEALAVKMYSKGASIEGASNATGVPEKRVREIVREDEKPGAGDWQNYQRPEPRCKSNVVMRAREIE